MERAHRAFYDSTPSEVNQACSVRIQKRTKKTTLRSLVKPTKFRTRPPVARLDVTSLSTSHAQSADAMLGVTYLIRVHACKNWT